MKIHVFEKGKTVVWLPLPNSMLFSSIVARLVSFGLRKGAEYDESGSIPQIAPEDMQRLLAELDQCARMYRGLTLVDVLDSDGDGVVITL